MTWGGLNPALTAWRNGINQQFPKRGTASDGGYADALHGSTSQHQADADGTVDAFDGDVNLLGSSAETGSPEERQLIEALKLDFQADPRAQLWIHQRQIANRDIGGWQRRLYEGPSPHDHHVHWQSVQAHEADGSPWKFTHTDALLRDLEDDVALTPDDINKIAAAVWNHTEDNPQDLDVKGKPKPGRMGGWIRLMDQRADARQTKLFAAITALAGKDQVDEKALAAELAPGVAALVIAALPAGGKVTEEQLQTAILGALRELAAPADHE